MNINRDHTIMNTYLETGKVSHSDLIYLLQHAAKNRHLENIIEQQKIQHKSDKAGLVKALKQRTTEVGLLRAEVKKLRKLTE